MPLCADSASGEGDQAHLGDGGEDAVAGGDAGGGNERAARLELHLAVEAVAAAVVAVGQVEAGDGGVDQVVVAVDDTVHDLDRDVVRRQRAQRDERPYCQHRADLGVVSDAVALDVLDAYVGP